MEVQANEVDKKLESKCEDQLTFEEFHLHTKEMFSQMEWFIEMYKMIGEANAHGMKMIRDDNTQQNWDEPSLNRHFREFKKTSTTVVDGDYKKLYKMKMRKKVNVARKPILLEDGSKRNNFAMPTKASDRMVAFFNAVDLGTVKVDGKMVPLQKAVKGLSDGSNYLSINLMINLFNIWINSTVLKDKQGNIIHSTRKDPVVKSKVYLDDIFVKYFKADLEKMIKEKKVKRLPQPKATAEIEGKKVVVPYMVPYPTFFNSLVAMNNEMLKDKDTTTEVKNRLILERNLVREKYDELLNAQKKE